MENLNTIFFYHLDKAIKSYRQYAQNKLKDRGFKITIDQWLVLKAVGDYPDATQIELAEAVFKDKASVTRIIEKLVQDNYLKRETHPVSKKRYRLTLTREGKSLLKKLQPGILKNRTVALKGISQQDIKSTEKTLIRVAKNCKL